MKLPINGDLLLQARKRGMKPRGVILITDTKKKHADCQLVIVPPFAYDFHMLRELDVFVSMETDFLTARFPAYDRWYQSTINDILKYSRELYVIPWRQYAINP